MDQVTFIVPLCNIKQEMLDKHLDIWQSLRPEITKKIKILIVDDCSTPPVDTNINCGSIPVKIVRVNEDIRWNAHAVFNIGFYETEGWSILLQSDHLFKSDAIEEILKIKKKRKEVYIFHRVFPDRPRNKDVSSIPLIHRDDWWLFGGYDEEFVGTYCASDYLFLGDWFHQDMTCAATMHGLKFIQTGIHLVEYSGLGGEGPKRYPGAFCSRGLALIKKKKAEIHNGTYVNKHKLLNKNWTIVRND